MSLSVRSNWFVAWLGLLLLFSSVASGAENAGKILFGGPGSQILDAAGNMRAARRGEPVQVGDTLVTKQSRIQIAFSDGGMMTVFPESEFKVADYHFSGTLDGAEKVEFSLVKGGLHAITGAIGKGRNPDAFKLRTPVATMGIRGTEFVIWVRAEGETEFVLYGVVRDGEVIVSNSAASLGVTEGAGFIVRGPGISPQEMDRATIENLIPQLKELSRPTEEQGEEDGVGRPPGGVGVGLFAPIGGGGSSGGTSASPSR